MMGLLTALLLMVTLAGGSIYGLCYMRSRANGTRVTDEILKFFNAN